MVLRRWYIYTTSECRCLQNWFRHYLSFLIRQGGCLFGIAFQFCTLGTPGKESWCERRKPLRGQPVLVPRILTNCMIVAMVLLLVSRTARRSVTSDLLNQNCCLALRYSGLCPVLEEIKLAQWGWPAVACCCSLYSCPHVCNLALHNFMFLLCLIFVTG